jgi:chromosome segregation ATPase
MTTRASESDGTPEPAGDGESGFLQRLFLALLKVGLALLILAGLAIGAWFIIRELDRSFDSVIVRTERNTRRIEETEAEINTLQEQNYARGVQIAALEAALAERESEIAALQEELDAGLDRQSALLAEVEGETVTLAGQAEALSGETALLGAGLVALQDDLNANGLQIDQLGGTVDGLSLTLSALDSRAAGIQDQVDELAVEDLAGWRRAVNLFRIWQMIGRARLRLVESNMGLAAADIELALAAIDELPANELLAADAETNGPAATNEGLFTVRERLQLAASNLPDQPQVAGRDLETAWETLDIIIASALVEPTPEG